jgi:hypothetical protein
MTTQFIINTAGEKVSAVIPFAEYQSLLETAFLLREPNGSILRQRIENVQQGQVIERELLSDEDELGAWGMG